MSLGRESPSGLGLMYVWRDALARAASLCMTIRGRILIAFLVMSVITAALSAYATLGITHAGALVEQTFDESLMSINYARAAATDFAGMRATFARRWIAADPQMRAAEAFIKMDYPGAGVLETVNSPVFVDGCAKRKPTAAAEVGAHTREVLGELGYSAEAIDSIVRR